MGKLRSSVASVYGLAVECSREPRFPGGPLRRSPRRWIGRWASGTLQAIRGMMNPESGSLAHVPCLGSAQGLSKTMSSHPQQHG